MLKFLIGIIIGMLLMGYIVSDESFSIEVYNNDGSTNTLEWTTPIILKSD